MLKIARVNFIKHSGQEIRKIEILIQKSSKPITFMANYIH